MTLLGVSRTLSTLRRVQRGHGERAGALHGAVLQRGGRPRRADQLWAPVAVRAGRADHGGCPGRAAAAARCRAARHVVI